MESNKRVVSNILDYIDSNLMEDISIQDIAGRFYFNRHYLMKMFKKTTGLTITQYVNSKKVIHSMHALANTDDRILKVALDNGYHSQEYYSEMFEKIVGVSPNTFRKKGYSPISLDSGGSQMEETKLERIERNIVELKNLRAQILGITATIEEEKKESVSNKPKMRVFRKDNGIKKAA